MTLPQFLSRRLALLCCAALLAAPALAQNTGEKWEPVKSGKNASSLRYSATATLLGKPTPVSLNFYCDTTKTRTETGALGFDLIIDKIASLAPFDFDPFEGPDAPAANKKLLRITVARPGKPPLVVDTSAAGWSPDGPNFAFGINAPSGQASSAKTILRALAEGADTLSLVVTDSKNAKRKLEVSVPVAAHAADFKAMLAGVK